MKKFKVTIYISDAASFEHEYSNITDTFLALRDTAKALSKTKVTGEDLDGLLKMIVALDEGKISAHWCSLYRVERVTD